MKTNNILITAIGIIFLMLTSCRPAHLADERCEGEDILLGNLTFDSNTLKVFPNNLNTKPLIFVNEIGASITLSSTNKIEDNFQLKIEVFCGEIDAVFGSNVYSYYNSIVVGEEYSLDLEHSINFSRAIRVATDYLPAENLYDLVNIGGRFNDTYFGTITMIASTRNNNSFPQAFFDEQDSYDFDESIELGGTLYENVYSSAKTDDWVNGKIYLTKTASVIGVLDKDDVFWKLQK